MSIEERQCPQCNTRLPVYSEYVTWCHECEWNLNPLKPNKPRNLFEATYEKLGQQQSNSIFTGLKKANSLNPRMTPSKFLAILFAIGIHLLTLSLPIVGLVLLSNEFRNFCTFIPAITCFVLTWELRPRFAKMPVTLSRDQFPYLYQFVDDIADCLGAKHVEGIVISDEYNASMWGVTWR
jgi:hypothetical protein